MFIGCLGVGRMLLRGKEGGEGEGEASRGTRADQIFNGLYSSSSHTKTDASLGSFSKPGSTSLSV